MRPSPPDATNPRAGAQAEGVSPSPGGAQGSSAMASANRDVGPSLTRRDITARGRCRAPRRSRVRLACVPAECYSRRAGLPPRAAHPDPRSGAEQGVYDEGSQSVWYRGGSDPAVGRFHSFGGRKMNRIMRPVLALVLAYAVAFAAFAAQEGLVSTQTRVKRVALFKNGLGFFVREGTLGANRQTILLGPFAAPSHGTFWVSAPASAGLKNVIARQTVMKGDIIVAKDISDLLRANLGKKVTLDGITGTIIGFAPDRPQPITPLSQYSMGPSPEQAGVIRPWGRGEYVLIRTEIAVLAINPYNNRVQFLSTTLHRSTRPTFLGRSWRRRSPAPSPATGSRSATWRRALPGRRAIWSTSPMASRRL